MCSCIMMEQMQQTIRPEAPLSAPAVAQLLGCSRATVVRAIQRGELQAMRLGRHGTYRIRREAIDAWLQPTGIDNPQETT